MKQRVIVCALVKKGDYYLFIKQSVKGGAYPNTLHIPGGGLDPGEDPRNAVNREILEETNIRIKNICSCDFDYDVLELYKGERTQLIFLRFIADYLDGEIRAGSDACEALWIHKDEIPNYPHNPPSLRFLSKVGLTSMG
jgi:8-oxo-dGTP pyrophosphatase MutT (NUDIX family)